MSTEDKLVEKKKCCKNKQSLVTTVDQLPLYGNPYPPKDIIDTGDRGVLEESIGQVRVAISSSLGFLKGFTQRSKEIMNTAIAHSKTTYDYITDEANTVPKAIAITGGGLFGLLLASRRGFFGKILYTSTGVGVMAGVCYPEQSMEMINVAGYIAKNKGPPFIQEYTGIDIGKYLNLEKEKKVDIDNVAQQVNQLGFRVK